MIYYPVIIPTLCRYEHLKRCIESLKRNTHSSETPVYISLDYPPSDKYKDGWEKIKQYLPTVEGFKEVHLFFQEDNLGAVGNWNFLVKKVCQKYEAYIATEDDNEFAPCFLDFMNKALVRYKAEPAVTSVSGFLHDGLTSKDSIIASPYFVAWGLGQWANKPARKDLEYYTKILKRPFECIKLIAKCPQGIALIIQMMNRTTLYADAMSCVYSAKEKKIQIIPSVNLVRNWGDDGSGINCGTQNTQSRRTISSSAEYTLDEIALKPSNKTINYFRWNYFNNTTVKKYFVHIYIVLRTICVYLKFKGDIERMELNYKGQLTEY